MINSIQRDQRRRTLVLKYQAKRVQYKALLQNCNLSLQLGKKQLILKARKTPYSRITAGTNIFYNNDPILTESKNEFDQTLFTVNRSSHFMEKESKQSLEIKGVNHLKKLPSNLNPVTGQERSSMIAPLIKFREVDVRLQKSTARKDVFNVRRSFPIRKIARNGSLTRVRNRCILTARGRGVLRFCKLSRICLRDLAGKGVLSGVSKASW